MSYAVEAVLGVPYNRDSILHMLERGKQLEVVFFYRDGEDYEPFRHLSAAEGAELLLSTDPQIIYDGGPILHAHIEDVLFWIRIQKKDENAICFSLESIGSSRERPFYNSGRDACHVNFDRYIRLLLKWCAGLCIESLWTLQY
ncbi:MAG TPA: hypothetical protein VGT41_01965 [Candidatus Babeliales bacterium]|nr:hypothetical protein [Candidatus Babeliales bacterium]